MSNKNKREIIDSHIESLDYNLDELDTHLIDVFKSKHHRVVKAFDGVRKSLDKLKVRIDTEVIENRL